jgi:tRNA(Ile)-lysidine synthase
VLVALSGGPDSLALAAATAFEAPRAGIRAGAVIVDHGLQEGSDAVSERAAGQARALGLDPVLVSRVEVATGPASATGGAEAAARSARYAAIDAALGATGARAVLLGHTLDDQAETVLLGLARGAGAASLAGMAPVTAPADADPHDATTGVAQGTRIRPLLGIRRAQTEQFCIDSNLEPWHDPHNDSDEFTRVRVRKTVLPLLERELGPGIAEALARTAEQLREDDDTLHDMATETIEDLVEHAEAGIAISAGALAANPAALRNRIIRYVVDSEFGVSLSRSQTLAVAALVTDWHGQKGVDLPGIRVVRQGALVVFSRV